MNDSNYAEPQSMRDEFLKECNNAFGFLVTDYNFSAPEIESSPNTINVFFCKHGIAVECVLDKRDEMVSVYISRIPAAKKPGIYKVNNEGEVVREYLTQLLVQRGIRDVKFEDITDPSPLSKRQRSFRKILLGHSRLLRQHGQDILNDFKDILTH